MLHKPVECQLRLVIDVDLHRLQDGENGPGGRMRDQGRGGVERRAGRGGKLADEQAAKTPLLLTDWRGAERMSSRSQRHCPKNTAQKQARMSSLETPER